VTEVSFLGHIFKNIFETPDPNKDLVLVKNRISCSGPESEKIENPAGVQS